MGLLLDVDNVIKYLILHFLPNISDVRAGAGWDECLRGGAGEGIFGRQRMREEIFGGGGCCLIEGHLKYLVKGLDIEGGLRHGGQVNICQGLYDYRAKLYSVCYN